MYKGYSIDINELNDLYQRKGYKRLFEYMFNEIIVHLDQKLADDNCIGMLFNAWTYYASAAMYYYEYFPFVADILNNNGGRNIQDNFLDFQDIVLKQFNMSYNRDTKEFTLNN